MRLHSIKISGFKSFADTAVIKFDKNLNAIVGPNGCGKSNIVDSVCWVMGESRASLLRQGSMSDVLFNGTDSRKPTDLCYVELNLRDVQDPKFGMWGQYSELIIKRELQRDGESQYFINNQKVRRRDVFDFFSKAGLSARGYGIIFQGTVGNITEANPERMRSYLEDVAGVSQYKERRREANKHLENTRQNLSRVDDMLSELTKQLDQLEKQSGAAYQHQDLSNKILENQAILLLLTHSNSKKHFNEKKENVDSLEKKIANLEQEMSNLDKTILMKREEHKKNLSELQMAQAHVYAAQADIDKSEQKLKHIKSEHDRQNSILIDLDSEQKNTSNSLQNIRDQINEFSQNLKSTTDEFGGMEAEIEKYEQKVQDVEVSMREINTRLEKEWKLLNNVKKDSSTYHARKDLICMRIKDILERIRVCRGRAQEMVDYSETVTTTEQHLDNVRRKLQIIESEQDEWVSDHKKVSEKKCETDEQILIYESEWVRLQAEHDLLRSSTPDTRNFHQWFHDQGKEECQRLSEVMQVDACGWEKALDEALGRRANAFYVERIYDLLNGREISLPAGMTLIECPDNISNDKSSNAKHLKLIEKLKVAPKWQKVIDFWLTGIYCSEDDQEAQEIRGQLDVDEAVVTQSGNYYTRDIAHGHSRAQGGYEWGKRRETVEKKMNNIDGELQEFKDISNKHNKTLGDIQEKIESAIQRKKAVLQELHEAEAICNRQKERASWQKTQYAEAVTERMNLRKSLIEYRAQRNEINLLCCNVEEKLKSIQLEIEENNKQRSIFSEELESIRSSLQHAKDQKSNLISTAQNTQSKLDSLNVQIEMLRTQEKKMVEQRSRIEKSLSFLGSQDLEMQLRNQEEAKEKALHCQAKMQEGSDQITAEIDDLGKNRINLESSIGQVRKELESERLNKQSLDFEMKKLENELDEHELSSEKRKELMSTTASVEEIENRITIFSQKRNKLGPVNFAAKSEMEEFRERKLKFEHQQKDLNSAIETLENAMDKIDDEMRSKLRSVFDRLNVEFSFLFKKMFGGGVARLEALGSSLLDSGIELRIQPPGKRVNTIQSLSGGEKTLVALALVFSIFKLSPAPFCIVDEVDAALDETNTNRLCKLLQELSQETQFIYITHNKTSLEIAERLIGVTQEEKGVSKFVTVSVEETARNAKEMIA